MMARPRSGVTPCTACNHPTRTSRASIQEFPGTRQRVRGLCRTCSELETPRPYRTAPPKPLTVRERRAQEQKLIDPADPATVASLDRFVQARNERLARMERMYR